jgi:hypothetical protein
VGELQRAQGALDVAKNQLKIARLDSPITIAGIEGMGADRRSYGFTRPQAAPYGTRTAAQLIHAGIDVVPIRRRLGHAKSDFTL